MIFELFPAQGRAETYAHPMAAFGLDDFMGQAAWQEGVQNAASLDEALGVPRNFSLRWGIGHKPRSMKLADWPGRAYLWPVCSAKTWAAMSPFCPRMGWIPLPPRKNGHSGDYGVLFGHQTFGHGEKPSKIVHFFAVGRGAEQTFVSGELRSALANAGLLGLRFAPVCF